MPKTLTQILTKQQKELLGQLLEVTKNKDKAITLMELEGFLFSRNEPCPCGSGKKYKKCCGMN